MARRLGLRLAAGFGILAAAAASTPTLSFSTFLGGTDFDQVYAIALDSAGNIYVAGQTASADFPTRTSGQEGNRDAFVAKLDASGTRLIYCTFLAGSQTEQPKAIAVDASGNAYVTGYTTSTDFPTSTGAYRNYPSGMEDAFVVKLNSTGVVVYSTYLGGSDRDFATGIAVDASGSAYITGYTHSSDFPITGGAYQASYKGGFWDGFAVKLNAAGAALVYSTFIGGAGSDMASAIAVDSSGSAYICGETDSANFPLSHAIQSANAGGMDAFITRLSSTGTSSLFSTYIGGSGTELANAIAIDAAGNAYISGATASFDFPSSSGAAQSAFAGLYDAFVVKIGVAGPSVVYSTLLGGSGSDTAAALSVDQSGNAWIAGVTSSANFPVMNPAQAQYGGVSDAFVAAIQPSGAGLLYSSFLGGSLDDSATAAAVDNKGGLFVAGNTGSANFPATSGVVQRLPGGSYDGFLAKFQTGVCGYAVNPLVLGVGGSGGTGSIAVTVPTGCATPGVSSSVSWASVSMASNAANWSVSANSSAQARAGSFTVAGQTVAIAQSGAVCAYSLSPASITAASGGASGVITTTPSPSDCATALVSSTVTWASVSISGNKASWTVSANAGSQSRTGSLVVGDKTVPITQSAGSMGTLALGRSSLNFAASGSSVTGPQAVAVIFNGGPGASWTASSNKSNISVSPAAGTGPGTITVTAFAGSSGVVTVTAPGAANSPQQLQVNVAQVAAGVPSGSFDTPANGSTGIAGAIPISGWALDNVEVTKVDIWREPVANESANWNGLIYLGDAVFVSGARPDVENANPAVPFNYRAGWGYLLLTNFLPSAPGLSGSGNGTYRLHCVAHGKSGAYTDLGVHLITVDNAHASKPFGTIDTPAQGATISGSSYVNFGWALTQNPYYIPTDGSTIMVTVDGVPVGRPMYNQYRSDIANAFPGLANSNGAVGYRILDTTTLANGIHSIGWVVYDNQGRGDGIGSRFFTVMNGGGGIIATDQAPALADGPVTWRRGFNAVSAATRLFPDGGWMDVDFEEMQRVELNLGAVDGCSLAAGERRPLPAGSSLRGGVFYWQPGPGFLGDYLLQFEMPDSSAVDVRVTVRPKVFR